MTVVEFTVHGAPRAQGSKRALVNRHTGRVVLLEMAKGLDGWRQAIRMEAVATLGLALPLAGPVAVELSFVFPWRKVDLRRDGTVKAGAVAWKSTTPDLDKLTRAVLDALTGVVLCDDALVAALAAGKRYGDRPGVTVRVSQLQLDPKEGGTRVDGGGCGVVGPVGLARDPVGDKEQEVNG